MKFSHFSFPSSRDMALASFWCNLGKVGRGQGLDYCQLIGLGETNSHIEFGHHSTSVARLRACSPCPRVNFCTAAVRERGSPHWRWYMFHEWTVLYYLSTKLGHRRTLSAAVRAKTRFLEAESDFRCPDTSSGVGFRYQKKEGLKMYLSVKIPCQNLF